MDTLVRGLGCKQQKQILINLSRRWIYEGILGGSQVPQEDWRPTCSGEPETTSQISLQNNGHEDAAWVMLLGQGTPPVWMPIPTAWTHSTEHYQLPLYSGLLQSMKGPPKSCSPTSFVKSRTISLGVGGSPKIPELESTRAGASFSKTHARSLHCVAFCNFKRKREDGGHFVNTQMFRSHLISQTAELVLHAWLAAYEFCIEVLLLPAACLSNLL